MKTVSMKFKWANWVALMITSLLISSKMLFAGGGDVYQIFLNDKLILKEVVYRPSEASMKQVQLSQAEANDNLVVIYYHCGTIGTGRHLSLKDESGKVYKDWAFANDPAQKSMTIPVREILKFKDQGHSLSLVYNSDQLQNTQRVLASVNIGASTSTSSREKSDIPLWTCGILTLGMIGLAMVRR
ncbi:MAG: hypothetical protein C5B52_11010 [Bacteroidetes bacterium]|nr:MAG: hypothetical protein C5B52_11010 [Bacteroidota bacterium]